MSKLKIDQIIEALECCTTPYGCMKCQYTPAEAQKGTMACSEALMLEVLAFLKGYRAEKENVAINVAEKIFADIEKFNRPPLPECKPVYVIHNADFENLKKKYTEGKQ